MEKKIVFIICTMVLTVSVAVGQSFTFKVLANKGQNKVKKPTGELVTLKTGALLFDQEEILSSEGAYIGLMHKTGKTTEIRGAGSSKVAELASKINTKKTSAASRYAQFIAAKMNEGDGSSLRSRTNTTGAVSRGADGAIEVLLPNSVDVFSEEAVVRWNAPEEAGEEDVYIVTIKNIFDDVIFNEETDKTSIRLNFTDMENESGLYIFNVKKKDNEQVASGDFGIKKVSAVDKPEVAQSLSELQAEIGDESALNKLMFAGFFEENALLLDALTQYEEAIRLSPEVDDFKALYEDFLIKNGIAQ